MNTNVPIDLLRAFVTVLDLGSVTRAAEALGRTQPAISLQIRRLEELLGAKMLNFEGRTLSLTEAGMALSPYARQMLRINDDIVGHFRREAMSGWVRVGLPADFANDFLLESVTAFAIENPEVRIEIASGLSRELRDELATDRLDIAVAIATEESAPYLVRSWSARPIWAIPDSRDFDPAAPLPIVRHPDPCEYADRMMAALRSIGRGWHSVYVAADVAGLQAAVVAGLGATALTRPTLRAGMRVPRADEGFPPMVPLRIGLFYKHARLSPAAHGIAQRLIGRIDDATDARNPVAVADEKA